MNKFSKKLNVSAIVVTLFYHPLIKLYNYLENNSLERTEPEEQECA